MQVDEKALAEAFREAVGDMPPASFNERDVTAASLVATARARRRAMVGAGAACGVLLLVGVGAVVTTLPKATSGQTVSAPAPGAGEQRGPSTTMSMDGGVPAGPNSSGNAGTLGPKVESGHSDCGPVDQGVAAALVAELPAATGVEAAAADAQCPANSRGAGFHVTDGTNSGFVEAVVVPATVPADPATGKPPQVKPLPTEGTRQVPAATRSGGVLTLISRPMNGSAGAPFGPQLNDIAARVATKF
ncbi:hypothetical protein [Kutzneria albida]|uniref:Uncharacterized protein n=1 Tax=Kutzneria albida DSM 43870 TaxID=1449976 RepID=W5WUU1_9PSEU|nr:hypothetical protein [Kutzneria albida]AHI01930.1 hypothetical protein KALB_8573 [Kutzneria albida DSM 43870]